MSLAAELLQLYESSLKEGTAQPVAVPEERRKEGKVGQVRELWTVPVERFVILSEENGLFLTTPLTSYLQLIPETSPIYELPAHGLRLGVVPVWDYIRKEIVETCSTVLGKVSDKEVERIKSYLKEKKELSYLQKRFIRLNSRRWANLTLISLLAQAELAEAEEEEAQTVKLSPEVEAELPEETVEETNYFKGKDYFAVLKKGLLRLYLPVEFVGRTVRIVAGDKVLFEGELERVRLELQGKVGGINPKELRVEGA